MVDPDAALLDALRAGDEQAFASLVRRHHMRLLRFAETLVPSRAVAEEVVQDTWLGVVRGIHRFEGKSSVKTWLFHILANRALSRAVPPPARNRVPSSRRADDCLPRGSARRARPLPA